jgi:hypothetical protein
MPFGRPLARVARAFPGGASQRTLRVCLAALGALTLSMLVASSALAKSPKGPFEVFSQCPTETATSCFYLSSTGGELFLHKITIPYTKTVTIQGGIKHNTEVGAIETFIGALNGETLSKTPQTLPGGLLSLLTCHEISEPNARHACETAFENKQTGVSVIAELAKPASEIKISKTNFFKEKGVALQLPVKLKFENAFLGSECYVGSSTSPVIWPLTTGTTSPSPPNEPIKGTAGTLEILEGGALEKAIGAVLVENDFSAPAVSGCGGVYSSVIDPILDEKIGLPAPAGTNTMVLKATVEFASAKAVVESE